MRNEGDAHELQCLESLSMLDGGSPSVALRSLGECPAICDAVLPTNTRKVTALMTMMEDIADWCYPRTSAIGLE